jgi:hypothetical protein
MFKLRQKLLAVAIGLAVSAGAFAQKREGDKRPPKGDDVKVVVQPKGERPPPSNNNQGDKRGGNDKKGKP